MKKIAKRALLDTIGWLFILFGVVGLFLPFLQGILFIVVGVYFLSLHSKYAHDKLHALRGRFPKVFGPVDRMDTKIRVFFGLEPL